MLKKLIINYEQQIAKWDIIIEKRPFHQTQQIISRKIMLEEVVQDLKELSERQSTIKDNNNADIEALHTADVVFSEAEVCQLKKAEYERGVEDGKIITEHGTVNWQT